MMRLNQVARILNVGTSTIVDHLSANGFKVDTNPNTKINADQLKFLAKEFKSDSLLGSAKPPKPTTEPAVEKSEEKEKLKSDFDEILYFRTPPKSEEKPAEEPVESALKTTSETRLPGIKVVGKIDLDGKRPVNPPKPEVKPEPAPEPVAKAESEKKDTPAAPEPKPEPQAKIETPAVKVENTEQTSPVKEEKVKEGKPVEEKSTKEEIQPKVEKTTPVVETPAPPTQSPEKTPEPVAQKDTPKQQPVKTAAPVADGNKKEPKEKDIAPKETIQPAAEEPSNVIEAKGQQLRGLKVVGKIELPSERGKKKEPIASSDGSGDKKRRRKRKRIKDAPGDTKPAVGTAAAPATGTPVAKTTSATPAKAGSASTGRGKSSRRGGRREEVSDKEVADNIKATMARMGGSGPTRQGRGGSKRRRDRSDQDDSNFSQEETKVLRVTEFISANELASLMDVSVQEVISVCMSMGMFVSINQRIDAEAIAFIADEFGFEVEFISAEEEIQNEDI